MPYLKHGAIAAISLIVLLSLFGNSRSYTYKESAVPEPVKLSPRLQALFEKTKILCFGRYALEVPQEAQLIEGNATFGIGIEIVAGDLEKAKLRADEKIRKLKWEDSTAEVTYFGPGPIADSWQMRYFEDKYAKADNSLFFETYVSKGEITFVLGDTIEKGETEGTVVARQMAYAKSLRLRAAEEVPTEPGFCIQHGFMPGDRSEGQERISAGIYLPSIPDVTFSVSSNKDAYADYKKDRFEEMKRDELPLLARIKSAQKTQGASYPKRDVLREGKRDVQHWDGEESLIRRPDGTHDFEWAFVGTPKDVAKPSEFHAAMFTKVAHNMVGAAKKASVSDDEAVALWDKLLSGLKFRVKVPGAPEGSYYFPRAKPINQSAE
ncbi:T6SS immunity protein Tli4 family protein [Massilia norwichensis]|uniref:T6SS immunity protein Tli4 family protein n=1 Tax=Massilia norwichensis TaxID=1442366 RepID=A0ABT2AER4_9BURK|nr:T6SS immunity protein Tli4 family protein [Massilia norwichensis]MCS0592633.1 T6SS immunity protein Tli4 family protein [Massilia norwichensis]